VHYLPNAIAVIVADAAAVTASDFTAAAAAYADSFDKQHYKELVITGRDRHTKEHEGVKAH
jgi:hypothetical protein